MSTAGRSRPKRQQRNLTWVLQNSTPQNLHPYAGDPLLYSVRKRMGGNGIMRAARRRHIAIGLTKANDATIARALKKNEICSVRIGGIVGLDAFVSGFLALDLSPLPPVRIPLFELLVIVFECVPNLH